MDRNLLLAFALSFLVLSLWTMYTDDPSKRVRPAGDEIQIAATEPTDPDKIPPFPSPELPDAEPLATLAPSTVPSAALPAVNGEPVEFETKLFRAVFDTLGGGLSRWELREYDLGPHGDHEPVVLTTGGRTLLTPFDELGLGSLSDALFTLEHLDANTFAFTHTRDGITVRKTYRFDEDSYAFRLTLDVENHSQAPISPRFLLTWTAASVDGVDFTEQALAVLHAADIDSELLKGLGTASFFGGAGRTVYDFNEGAVDWGGVQNTYFLSAALPDQPAQASAQFVATQPGQAGRVRLFFPPVQIPSGQSASREYRCYIGPKEVDRLEAVGGGLIESIDLGWSWITPMTRFFGWLLRVLYELIPNYGVAIILLTILVRVVTAPLTTKQMKSMERMRELQPKLKELQAKYSDDRQKQSEETMRLYRSEGVNPLGGCLPMVLQLPVMVGLFYALRSSIQLRQAPFVAWIDDLSAPETLFMIPGLDLPVRLLPLIMGGTMVLQQRMTPMNVDPAQARMMMTVMPIMMTFLFYQFASGLVLYWMVGNVLAISHQLWIRRQKAAKE